MRERLSRVARRPVMPRRPLLLMVGLTVGFLAVVGGSLHPPDPESRLPESQRLSALIDRRSDEVQEQRAEVELLRRQLADERGRTQNQGQTAAEQKARLDAASLTAGLTSMEGQGLVVVLNDSTLEVSPTGNVNDLVIHSQDVQAVVNGMWAAGADAVSINGQRVIATSAVLCVGNTLLINATVQSPPYEVTGIGVDRGRFLGDPLIRELRDAAERFSLRLSVGDVKHVQVPAYSGLTSPQFAKTVS